MKSPGRELLLTALETALGRLSPRRLVEEALRKSGIEPGTLVVALGKSAIPMTEGAALFASEIEGAIVVAPAEGETKSSPFDFHPALPRFRAEKGDDGRTDSPCPGRDAASLSSLPWERGSANAPGLAPASMPNKSDGPWSEPLRLPLAWRLLEGDHPIPGPRSFAAGRELVRFCELDPERPLLALISGGGSSLAELPRPPLGDEDLVLLGRELLLRGLPIAEMNAIRRALSAIKGGGLARLRTGALRTLVLSDVGSDPAVVASGPTLPPPGTPEEDAAALERFLSASPLPADLVRRAREAAKGRIAPKGSPSAELLASPADLARAFAAACEELGIAARVREENFEGAVDEVARRIVDDLRGVLDPPPTLPIVLVRVGEPTLSVPAGSPPGGRASHLALLLARRLGAIPPDLEIAILSVGSDGVDGTGGAAGALITGAHLRAWQSRGGEIDELLAARRSHDWLLREGALLPAHPTGVNLRDLVAVGIGRVDPSPNSDDRPPGP